MTARWRLVVLALQLVALGTGTTLVAGHPYSPRIWFFSGLLAVVINPQLLEPYYPRPGDVVANSLVGLLLVVLAPKHVVAPGWFLLAALLLMSLAMSVAALALGAGRQGTRAAPFAQAARQVSLSATSVRIFSIVFWLALLEDFPPNSTNFAILGTTWFVLVLLRTVNWQAALGQLRGETPLLRVEGMLGPGLLRVVAPALPAPGGAVLLRAGDTEARGMIVTRIRRSKDTWAEIWVADATSAERLLDHGSASIVTDHRSELPLGSAGAGSTDRTLRFTAARPTEIGRAVIAPVTAHEQGLLYQVAGAEIREARIKGGAHLVVDCVANQVGVFDPGSLRLSLYRWVPEPGAPVYEHIPDTERQRAKPPKDWLLVGNAIGTDIPVFIDLAEASEGHIAILGMTRMGKTSLALRLARALAGARCVVVLDQTGEYLGKRGVPSFDDKDGSLMNKGLSVLELPAKTVGAEFALEFVQRVISVASAEYAAGTPNPRTIMIDEAHQFIPEPAGLGFGTPGRDQSYQLGIEILQVRKLGMSMILISQRTAVVGKSALSQCENLIAFKSVDQTGLDYVEQMAGAAVRNILATLKQGEALVTGPAFNSDAPVAVSVARGEDMAK